MLLHAGLASLGLLLLCTASSMAAAPREERLRPPAAPLVAHDPYFSIWSPADRLNDADTIHWTGRPHRLTSAVTIDGVPYRLLGGPTAGAEPLPQVDLQALPTRTIAAFQGAGVHLTLTFMTPALPEDLDLLARPVTYVTWAARSTDGRPHTVAPSLSASAEIAVNEPAQPAVVARLAAPGLAAVTAASADQQVLAKRGDDLRIDWGRLCLAAPNPARARWRRAGAAATGQAGQAAAADLTLTVAPPAMAVDQTTASRWAMIAYDDELSIRYFRARLRPYWRRAGAGLPILLRRAAADYAALGPRCAAFDARLMADLTALGGAQYARLCALAYRQTLAGNKLAADAAGKPLLFPKECFSNGCIATVDVLFPQAPFFLALSPALTKAMLVPVLDYAASAKWPYDYAPHDLGTYPWATGQVYGMGGTEADRMPVEESGNMLIMLAALARAEGNAELARPHWAMLTKWADYLKREGLDPANQLCSADMFGHMPRNANLALKAIIGIGAHAQLAAMLGHADAAAASMATARDYAGRWQQLARDDGRTRLAYDRPGTWSMKHNLIWDRVLGLNLLPQAVGDAEIAWYRKVQRPFGLPVDGRTETSLIDWALWSIAPARSMEDFQALLAPIYRYANETPTRVPLSDWFVTTTAKQQGFQARPVVGGLFIRLLADHAAWKRWAAEAQPAAGPWAPIDIGRPIAVLAPTAQTAQVTWRYTLAEPPAGWNATAFDDSAWSQGVGGFGTAGTPGAIIGTAWSTQDLWLRREITLPDRPLRRPRFLLIYDEDPEVYLNGVLAARPKGWATAYDELEIAPAALRTLRPGRNTLAIRVRQTTGGQSIDLGLIEDAP